MCITIFNPCQYCKILFDIFSENEVYAWGNNAMGQCGQGHSQSPITSPKKVLGLEGVTIHQISAGTSHSMAWTALPTDRYLSTMYYAVPSIIVLINISLLYLLISCKFFWWPLSSDRFGLREVSFH